jgi:prepilin-type N-terminal cleavage/methylation domain-containing protein
MNLRTKKQQGFTIVELLIVIVVIAILAAISIVAYTNVQRQARDTERAANAKSVVDALAIYNAEKEGGWPTAVATDLATLNTVTLTSDLLAKIVDAVAAPANPTTDIERNEIHAVPAGSPTSGFTVYYWQDTTSPAAWKSYTVGVTTP